MEALGKIIGQFSVDDLLKGLMYTVSVGYTDRITEGCWMMMEMNQDGEVLGTLSYENYEIYDAAPKPHSDNIDRRVYLSDFDNGPEQIVMLMATVESVPGLTYDGSLPVLHIDAGSVLKFDFTLQHL